MPEAPILYSTNPAIKLLIQREYRGDVHYVWCSEYFDSRRAPAHSLASLTGRSSNPADIYRELKRDTTPTLDRHSAKINQMKGSLLALATTWKNSGQISTPESEEITFLLENSGASEWRPLLYVIPRGLVAARMKEVPPAARSGFGREWIIEDLKSTEFDAVELDV